MRILLTNDDGIWAEGIRVLAAVLSQKADVYIVAPDRERSASSHSITFHKPLRVEVVSMPKIKNAWQVDGTPSDCVKIALNNILDFKPDLLVSGINRGPNLGCDVLYSGTVSAAIEGFINGVPSVAISMAAYEDLIYEPAAEFIRDNCELFENTKKLDFSVLNINFPNVPAAEMNGNLITKLGDRRYDNIYDVRKDPRGRDYYWLAGDVLNAKGIDFSEDGVACDVDAIEHKFISMTPLHIDLTAYKAISELQSIFPIR